VPKRNIKCLDHEPAIVLHEKIVLGKLEKLYSFYKLEKNLNKPTVFKRLERFDL